MNKRLLKLGRVTVPLKIGKVLKKKFPRWQAERLYAATFHRKINWKHPTEFNEKLRWLQFNTDTSKWTLLADKYRVRNYLEKIGYGDLLVKLYGVWEEVDKIDFASLPNKFVLKTNHGSGSVFVVRDKSDANLEEIKKKLNRDLSQTFGIETAEPHYFPIKPVIIAEELLEQDGEISTSLIDYKFYCIYGEPQFCGVMYNRNQETHKYDVRLYDNEWKDISHLLSERTRKGKGEVPKPKNFDKMIEFCKTVCKEFPFVRMDFYECNGKLYFGEFTFTPAACTGGSLGEEASSLLANLLDRKTYE